MADDMFDLGDGGNDDGSANDANNEGNANTGGSGSMAINETDTSADPKTTEAFDTEYRDNQHTVAALDETWSDVVGAIEDAGFYFRQDDYENLSKLERWQAFFELASERIDAEDIADRAKQQRHDAHE